MQLIYRTASHIVEMWGYKELSNQWTMACGERAMGAGMKFVSTESKRKGCTKTEI